MNKLLFLFLVLTTNLFSQTIIRYDYMETWNWAGLWWTPAVTAGWATNASVSATESAVLYGLGSGTSAYELDWYSLPNVTGLNTTSQYVLKFRLASYTFSNSTAATRGVDVGDYVSVLVSTDGGVTYITELRITGNNNATWPYNTAGVVNHIANGSFTNSAAPIGDVYTSPIGTSTNGPSDITLNLPTNISQVAIDLFCRANGAGEEWWIDNIELIEIPNSALPVELIYFTVQNTKGANVLQWQTASEHNSDYFLIEKSVTGEFTEHDVISIKPAAGQSTELINYTYADYDYSSAINYYRLTQVDRNGMYKIYGPIAIDNTNSRKTVVKLLNTLGQQVDQITTPGVYIEVFDDGTARKVMR